MKHITIYFFLGLCLFIFSGCQDRNRDFHHFAHPARSGSMFPHLFVFEDRMYMSWLNDKPGSNSTASLQFAAYTDGSWSSVDTIAQSTNWFINWADFPSVIANSEGPAAAHWLNKKPGGTYAYDVNISFIDDNQVWSSSLIPHSDSTATEHGFASMIPWDHNSILAVWLDGRRSANRKEGEYFDLNYAMTLRGALISNSGKIEHRFLIDESVCDCCSTSLVKTPKGALLAYRNRTDDEVRDIYISRFNGKSWSKGRAVHHDGWKIGACPVNGPALAAKDSLIGLAWPTTADDTLRVKAVLSTDGGRSFSDPVAINKNEALGRVDIDIAGNKAYVSWLEKEDQLASLNLLTVDPEGNTSSVFTADSISTSRNAGFPQMKIAGREIILAWTTSADSSTSVKMIKKGLPLLPS